MNQFTKEDKDHIFKGYVHSAKQFASDPKVNVELSLLLQLRQCEEDYRYWKERMKDLDAQLKGLKSAKTLYYEMLHRKETTFGLNLFDINTKLFWWRSYYPLALEEYYGARNQYYCAQRYYANYLEDTNKIRNDAKSVKGKSTFEIVLKHSYGFQEVFNIRLTTDENPFKVSDFIFMAAAALEEPELPKYSWNAFWNLKNIVNFSNNPDIVITITPIKDDSLIEDVLIDFERYKVFKNGGLSHTLRLTYNEYKERKEKELGYRITGFKKWYASQLEDVLEKRFYGHSAYDVVDCGLKHTYQHWDKFYNMHCNGENVSDRDPRKVKILGAYNEK